MLYEKTPFTSVPTAATSGSASAFSSFLLPVALFLSGFCAMGFLAFYQTIPLSLKGIGQRYSGTATGLIITVQLAASVVLPSYVIAPIAGDDYRLIFLMLGAIPLLPAVLSPFLPVKDMFEKK